MPRPRLLADRFWSHVTHRDDPQACWLWTGALDSKTGYGQFVRQMRPIKFVSLSTVARGNI